MRCGSIDPKEIDPCEVSLCRIYGAFQKQGRIPPGIELAIAHTDFNLLPAEKLQKCIVDTIRYNCQDCLNYITSPGDFALREQISKHYIFHGTQLSSNDIIITNGCQEAVFLTLLSICNAGDTVAIETPSFFNFIQMLEVLQLKILEIPCTCEEGMSVEALEFALENQPVKAVISIPNFSNPMGSLMPENRKKYLVKLLEKHNVPLIEDDINSDIYYNDR